MHRPTMFNTFVYQPRHSFKLDNLDDFLSAPLGFEERVCNCEFEFEANNAECKQ